MILFIVLIAVIILLLSLQNKAKRKEVIKKTRTELRAENRLKKINTLQDYYAYKARKNANCRYAKTKGFTLKKVIYSSNLFSPSMIKELKENSKL